VKVKEMKGIWQSLMVTGKKIRAGMKAWFVSPTGAALSSFFFSPPKP
jgi:hypothetical protein